LAPKINPRIPVERLLLEELAQAAPSSLASIICEPAAAVLSNLISILVPSVLVRAALSEPICPSSSYNLSFQALSIVIQTLWFAAVKSDEVVRAIILSSIAGTEFALM
jgi:hypothetical protein